MVIDQVKVKAQPLNLDFADRMFMHVHDRPRRHHLSLGSVPSGDVAMFLSGDGRCHLIVKLNSVHINTTSIFHYSATSGYNEG